MSTANWEWKDILEYKLDCFSYHFIAILRLGAKGFEDTSIARNSVIYDVKHDIIFYLKFFAQDGGHQIQTK